ncbi:hypothetical protein Pta02_10650 [Planobispora takensis]|uniref:Uncharacterized protein n=1 Tax=Planobispora takensis TaxID=1367882 RepID=A0A8J3SR62_9ACTN|nr:hypothetical protein Pta02_10650 [Planobispora takensis]
MILLTPPGCSGTNGEIRSGASRGPVCWLKCNPPVTTYSARPPSFLSSTFPANEPKGVSRMIAVILIVLMVVTIVGFELLLGSYPRVGQDALEQERSGLS